MKTKKLRSRKQRKTSLLISVTTMFAAAFVIAQLMFAPSMVQTVYAGSTLTPTSQPVDTNTPVPVNTPVPPVPTETMVPVNTPVPPTSTPAPSNTGGSSSQSPSPTPIPVPELPQDIPELGVGSTLQPLLLTLAVLLFALMIAVVQVRHLLSEPKDGTNIV